MPLPLVGFRRPCVSRLVVADDFASMSHLGGAPSPAEHDRAPLVQCPAHLLRRHLGVFPPAAAPCEWQRTRGRSGPTSGAGVTRYSSAPRSPSIRPLASPAGKNAPPSTAG